MMLKPSTNYVLVRQEGAPGHSAEMGLAVFEFAEESRLESCIGRVVAVCDDLYYGGYEIAAMPRPLSPRNAAIAQHITQYSTYFDVPIEVKPGDKVLFRHRVLVDDERLLYDGCILMRYDDLVARLDDGEEPYPLNGGVFVERFDSYEVIGGVSTYAVMFPGAGKVVSEGALVKSYLLWPEKRGDFNVPLVGHTILFQWKDAVRIEHDSHRMIHDGRQYPLYQVHRYAINAIVNAES